MFKGSIAGLGLLLMLDAQAHPAFALAPSDGSESQPETATALQGRLAEQPANADLWRRLAAAQAADGDLAAAYASISRALALAPNDRDIQIARANILLWQDRLTLAEEQAEAVRAVDPNYPGLTGFDRAFGLRQTQISRFGPIAVSAVVGRSDIRFESGARQNWENAVVAVAVGNTERTIFEIQADAERRAATDVRLSARATTRTGSGSYYIGAGITPNADFRDQWRLAGGGQARLAPGLRGTADLRLARYRSGLSASIEPGLSYAPVSGLTVAARMINLLDGDGDYRIGAAARADYELAGGHILFASAARYPDREADVTKQLRSFALGGAFNLAPRWRVSLAAADEKRKDSYRSQSVNLGLTYRFAQP